MAEKTPSFTFGDKISEASGPFSLEFKGWPSNVPAEAAFLGGCMIDNRIIGRFVGRLEQRHFFEALHGRIWQALVTLSAAGKTAITPVTLKPLFEDDFTIKELGGIGYLVKLTSDAAALVGAEDFAAQIIELSRRRDLIKASAQAALALTSTSFEEGVRVENEISKLNAALWKEDGLEVKKPLSATSAFERVIERQREIDSSGYVHGAISKTIEDITDIIGPLTGGNVTYIGARPSVGKTALALSFAMGLAFNGHATDYMHNEMNRDDISMRHATDLCFATGNRIALKDIRLGRLKPDQMQALERAKEQASALPLRFHDIADRDIEYVRALARRSAALYQAQGRRLEVLVIDYLQKLDALDESGRVISDSRHRVNRVSKGLMAISKELDCHVIALTQLGRDVDSRPDRKPRTSDLKESGDLEQDADNVLLLWRPEMHLADEEPDKGMPGSKQWKEWEDWYVEMEVWRNKMEIIGGKVRHGARKNRRVRFFGENSAVRGADFDEYSDGDIREADLFGS